MSKNDTEYLLKQAASRAADSDYFLAKVFRTYEKIERLTSSTIAHHLGCTPETLIRVALCRRPYSDDPGRFKADIERIAEHFNLDAPKLANLVRYVDTMKSLSQSPQLTVAVSDLGILLTARDQEEKTEPKEPEKKVDDKEEKKGKDEENGTA